MAEVSVHLNEDDIKRAISYWLEQGMPPPSHAASVLFYYDKPTGNPMDPGNGVTADVRHPNAHLSVKAPL